ncbi:unnamed protein product [Staurois parvus]|uniref:Uncharacterized protein n=1 Tax=Staurois parvus TaxID=386267 RepID=A0ABN9BHK5_9NEOB|nr:unnamed protein product [Staurois parvus]
MMPCTQSRHPVPEAAKQPQNIIEPPPYFTVGTSSTSVNSSPLRRHTVLKPSVPKTSILVSSLQSTESQ